jgi:hypothetical protein
VFLALLVARHVLSPPMLPSVFLASLVTTSLLVILLVPVLSVLLPLPTVVLLAVNPRDHSPEPLPNGLPLSVLPVPSLPTPLPLPMVSKMPPLVSWPHVATVTNFWLLVTPMLVLA